MLNHLKLERNYVRIIQPVVTGSVTINLSIEDAKAVVDSIDAMLNVESPTWPQKLLRDHNEAKTAEEFSKVISKILSS